MASSAYSAALLNKEHGERVGGFLLVIFFNFLLFLLLLIWAFFSTEVWGRGEREENPPEVAEKGESNFLISLTKER